jgi:hypothetical protein
VKQIWLLGVLLAHGGCCVGLKIDPPGQFGALQGLPALTLYEPENLRGAARDGELWELEEINKLEKATYAAVTGPTFRAWLAAAVELSDGSTGYPVGARVLDEYLGKRGRGDGEPRIQRHVVVLDRASSSEVAHTQLGGRDQAATITLRSPTMERWRAGSYEQRACAINTVAHEWTHLVTATGSVSTFQDGCHALAAVPLVSYTVGAIAQCAYLVEQGKFPIDMAACVAAVGTTEFDDDTCRAGWAASLNPAVASVAHPRRATAGTVVLCTEGSAR